MPGTHEYYRATKPDVDSFWRAFAGDNEGFHYLNRNMVGVGGLRFYGAEWRPDSRGDPMHYHYERDVADFWLIRDWSAAGHVEEFRRVTGNMAVPSGKVNVVITHYPPTPVAIEQALYPDDPLNPYFVNDCESLVRRPEQTLRVSGHTHSPFDYRVVGTRLVINTCGYIGEAPLPGLSLLKTMEV